MTAASSKAPRAAVSMLLYLMDEAFQGTQWHSLLSNLQSVKAEDWLWVPPDGRRSICDIVYHVAGSKLMYENHAFGEADLTWDDAAAAGADRVSTIADAVAWLQEGQAQLRESVASLDDDELTSPRHAPSGKLKETRWLIAVMIEHDLYHAGEINHIRCLHQGDDE